MNELFNDRWIASLLVRFVIRTHSKPEFLAYCREVMPDDPNWNRENALKMLDANYDKWARHAANPHAEVK
jgi:hypothetical protein